jgi:mono/diheme cytochrome c family protein
LNRVFSIVVACACAAAATSAIILGNAQAQSQQTLQDAVATFQARCSTCHAEHGEGSDVGASLNVPDLRADLVQKNEDASLRQVIKNGKGNMPPFGRDFSEQEIDRIIQLVRSFAVQISEQAQTKPSAR